jgi:hypothetical protein
VWSTMRTGMVVSGIVLTVLGVAYGALFFLTDTVRGFTSVLQFALIAGAVISAGLILLVLGVTTRSKSRIAMTAGSQAASGALCPKCGGQLPLAKGKIRCPYCGRKVSPLTIRGSPQLAGRDQALSSQQTVSTREIQRFCTYCGASLHPTAIFCQRCGKERRI